ncbi:outer membrane beta-barrel protein [uncultured Algibacter sp.]|uniref:outer membrane beta-barrel protein n=1 Tax=uncultured Algibacter sp. TaxID=298659 RepID=UPI0026035C77|nr:outer membrane beta-barrel protein [uncultured Algibacter sp.]
MKHTTLKHVFLILMAICFSSSAIAQDEDIKDKKERKARSSFKISAGVNLNGLNIDTAENPITSDATVGYNFGISYKRGRFFYYEVGARYNKRPYDFTNSFDSSMTSDFSMSALDIPITGGLNITSFADRLVGVRVFVSGIPSFVLSKDPGSSLDSEDQIENFIFYGQLGLGVDIAFFFVELGFNYGFDDMVNTLNSNPAQGYLNLGFRF